MKKSIVWLVLLLFGILVTLSVTDSGGQIVTVSSAHAQTSCVAPPSGLINWWPGDGNTNDIQNGNDGVLVLGTTFDTGQVGQAFSFDGVNDYIQSIENSNLTGNPSFTIDAWIKVPTTATTTGAFPPILWWGQNSTGKSVFFSLEGTNRNKLFVGFFGAGQRMVGTFSNDQWHHVAWVRNGGGGANQGNTLYVDGVSVLLEDVGLNPAIIPSVTDSPYRIQSAGLGRFFEGLIDEVEVFDRALSSSEIQDIYNSGSAGKCKPICGNGIIESRGNGEVLEQCDDNNAVSGDGCSQICTIESTFECAGQPSVCTEISCIDPPPNISIIESGWCLKRAINFSNGQAAHYNPIDGLIYVGRRFSGLDGLYRINADGSALRISGGDRLAAVMVDHDDGDILFSEDFGGNIYRTAFNTLGRTTWVSGFHSGDDDPVGMAIAPDNYTGSVINAGEALVVDRGHNGPDEVWHFSPDTPEGETLIHPDDVTLIDPVDITIGLSDVYLVDEGGITSGKVYRVNANGSLTLISTPQPIIDPAGIATDPLTGDLLVLDSNIDRLVRFDPVTNAFNEVFTGFSIPYDGWAGVDISPDGSQIFITDNGAGKIYVFKLAPSNQPPSIAADQPTDHVDEGQTTSNTGTVSDPDGDEVTLTASVGTVTNNNDGTWSWSFTTSDGPTQSQMVTIDADDGNGGTAQTTFQLTVNNVAPTVDVIAVPLAPVAVSAQPVSASANFSDAGTQDVHTAVWDWGDNDTSAGTVNETNGSGTVADSHTYAEPGVYTVRLLITDDDGGQGESVYQYVVVYDSSQNSGFVTGAGHITSPLGAYLPDPELSGMAKFGFVSKYRKGATIPEGQTHFKFKVADLEFRSTQYEWLVVAGHKAMFKGVGTINGSGTYGFMISAIDEKLTPSTDVDLFRIKIWDKDNGDAIVYDNLLGADDDVDPTTAIDGGNIVIH